MVDTASDAWKKFVEESGKKLPRFPAALAAAIKNIQEQQEQIGMRLQDLGGSHAKPTKVSNRMAAVDESGAICVELIQGGLKRIYRERDPVFPLLEGVLSPFDCTVQEQTHVGRVKALVQSYLLPQGFPDSVAPQYASYMFWRGVQYLFGGAISVFTTKSLLGALGVGKHAAEGSAAINWVIKDGAGRLGRLLFARWGRELDCELKQFRLFGDLLLEGGAALELTTAFAPRFLWLPLACTANLSKNLAAVAASSTRAPIYRTFALSNNMADITAKGESVANLADIIGTLLGIGLSKAKLPLVPTFCFLSLGYLFASRKEVDSVELPYLNRARMAYSMSSYLTKGVVPGVREANNNEWLIPVGGYHQSRIILGSSISDSFLSSADLASVAPLFSHEKFILSYRHDTRQCHVVLREGAANEDILKAAFASHVLLHLADGVAGGESAEWILRAVSSSKEITGGSGSKGKGKKPDSSQSPLTSKSQLVQLVLSTQAAVGAGYQDFVKLAGKQSWRINQTMLNPRETRLLQLTMNVTPLKL
jgi:hypothetical protein